MIPDFFHAGNPARCDKHGFSLAFTNHETPKVHDPFAYGDVVHNWRRTPANLGQLGA